MGSTLLLAFLGGIGILLFSILILRVNAFRYGATKEELQEISMKALGPAGVSW